MIDYTDKIKEQMNNARFRKGVWERLEDGKWVKWPVLTIKKSPNIIVDRYSF